MESLNVNPVGCKPPVKPDRDAELSTAKAILGDRVWLASLTEKERTEETAYRQKASDIKFAESYFHNGQASRGRIIADAVQSLASTLASIPDTPRHAGERRAFEEWLKDQPDQEAILDLVRHHAAAISGGEQGSDPACHPAFSQPSQAPEPAEVSSSHSLLSDSPAPPENKEGV